MGGENEENSVYYSTSERGMALYCITYASIARNTTVSKAVATCLVVFANTDYALIPNPFPMYRLVSFVFGMLCVCQMHRSNIAIEVLPTQFTFAN